MSNNFIARKLSSWEIVRDMIYPREDEYLREDLEAIFDEFMEIVSSCPSSFIVHWAWNRGVRTTIITTGLL